MHCDHFKSIVKVCLVNGPTEYEGTMEVYYNGEWGSLCDDGWSWNNAEVVCRQLGLGPVVRPAFYGSGSNRIWLNYLYCNGTESNIGHCPHQGWGYEDGCSHEDAVGMKCTNPNGMQFYLS